MSDPLPTPRRLLLLLALLLLALWLAGEHVATPWTVAGPSMRPTLQPGDRVLVDVWSYRHRLPRPGEIVLVRLRPDRPLLVKRAARPPDATPLPGAVWVLGDNPQESADSRRFGAVPAAGVAGRVLWRYWPPSRIGRLPAAPG